MAEFKSAGLREIWGKIPLTIFVTKEQKKVLQEFKFVDIQLEGRLEKFLGSNDFDAALGAVELFYANSKLKEPRIAIIALGPEKDFNREVWQKVMQCAALFWQKKRSDKFSIIVPKIVNKFGTFDAAALAVKGVLIGSYEFKEFKTDEKRRVKEIKQVLFLGLPEESEKQWESGIEYGKVIGSAINRMRDLGNLPPNLMTPAYLAGHAESLGRKFKGLKVKVLDKAEMQKLKMGAILGVNAGAAEPPKFIIMEWWGAGRPAGSGKNADKKAPFVLVGKGITFDSGGISLKPGDKMDEMKFDMLGAAVVIETIAAVAELGLKANVVALAPATENLPSGSAYRPGDILTGMGGKTIEIINTDAEGRVILSDALEYAKKYKPAVVVDYATLTGACVRALGEEYAGLFTNESRLKKIIEESAGRSNDNIWQLPLHPVHTQGVKSEIADVRNLAFSPLAGASTGAAFLKEFTNYPWAHIDIAGVAWLSKGNAWQRIGATGWGVHISVEMIKKFFDVK